MYPIVFIEASKQPEQISPCATKTHFADFFARQNLLGIAPPNPCGDLQCKASPVRFNPAGFTVFECCAYQKRNITCQKRKKFHAGKDTVHPLPRSTKHVWHHYNRIGKCNAVCKWILPQNAGRQQNRNPGGNRFRLVRAVKGIGRHWKNRRQPESDSAPSERRPTNVGRNEKRNIPLYHGYQGNQGQH